MLVYNLVNDEIKYILNSIRIVFVDFENCDKFKNSVFLNNEENLK